MVCYLVRFCMLFSMFSRAAERMLYVFFALVSLCILVLSTHRKRNLHEYVLYACLFNESNCDSWDQTEIETCRCLGYLVHWACTKLTAFSPKKKGFFLFFRFETDTHKRLVGLCKNFVFLPNVEISMSITCSIRMLFSWALFKCSAFSILFMSFIKDSI